MKRRREKQEKRKWRTATKIGRMKKPIEKRYMVTNKNKELKQKSNDKID